MAKLATEWVINAQAQIVSLLARVQRALADAENARQRVESEHGVAQEALALVGEACRKAEEENGHLTDERLALIMELGTIKDDFAAFREKVVADRETMEAKFDASDDTLFNYGYGCYVFTHNIRGSKPQILDGMSDPSVPLTPEFFTNPRCPLGTPVAALWTPLPLARRIVQRIALPQPERRRLLQRLSRLNMMPLLSGV